MPTPSIIETEIVNRLVRGDKPKDLAAEFNIGIATVYHIRNRQAQAIEAIENKVSKHKQRITARILEKAQKQLEKRIDESDSYDELVNQIRDEYDEIINNINEQEENAKQLYKDAQWWRDAKIAKLKRLSAAELVTSQKKLFTSHKLNKVNQQVYHIPRILKLPKNN